MRVDRTPKMEIRIGVSYAISWDQSVSWTGQKCPAEIQDMWVDVIEEMGNPFAEDRNNLEAELERISRPSCCGCCSSCI